MRRFLLTLLVALIALSGCSKQSGQGGASSPLLGTSVGSASGVKWSVPKRWVEQGQRPMRVGTYVVPASEGDTEPGECAIFYFGVGQGGSVDDNINRWVGQFEQSGVPAKSSKDIGGLKVTLVQIAGAYLAPGGPMMQSTGKKENYRLLGAIVEAPQGPVFFKFTGPAKSVGAAEGEFNAMIESLTKI
ncbi:MAG TPA: hypothetical protein VL126_00470 [Bacteroidota bacterium]|nr:hypothetical protein [Bacteroidota bacterium]